MKKRCYVVGAGFSQPLGFPLASELTRLVIDHVSSNANEGVTGPLGWALSKWISFLKKLYPCCDFNTTWPNFEDLITTLDEWEEYRHDVQGTPPPRGSMHTAHIKKVLLRHLAQMLCEKTPAVDDTEFTAVRRFVKECSEHHWSVISFNWDVVLEVAAKDENIGSSYESDTDGCLLLAKPHGSINVALIETRFADRWGGINSVTKLSENHNSIIVCAKNPREAMGTIITPLGISGKNNSDSSNPCGVLLVEPTARKSYTSPWLREQWKRAFDFVRAADEIIIIGFSGGASNHL